MPSGSSPLVDSNPNDDYELGVAGSPRGETGWPTQQIEYDSTAQHSEAIELQFNGQLNQAHLELGHLIGNEHDGEVAHWYALLDGQVVAEGEVHGAGGASITTPVDINTDSKVFNEIRLEAREYADGSGSSVDSSDFFIQSVYGSGPAEANGSYVVYEGDTLNTAADLNDAVHGVLYNDSDPEGDAISVIKVNGQPLTFNSDGEATVSLTYGSLTINQNGQFSYTATADLDPGEVEQEHFTYTIEDQYGNTLNLPGGEGANVVSDGDSVATTTITVIGRGDSSNQVPETSDDTVITCEDTVYTFSISDFGQYSDMDGDQLAVVSIDTLPENGQLLFDGDPVTAGSEISATDIAAGKLQFHPATNTDADSSFAFRVSDGTDWSGQHNVTLDVKAVADVPDVDIEVTPQALSTITIDNVTNQGEGFTVSAFHEDGTVAPISIVSGTNHDGFGVQGLPQSENSGLNPGADTELSHDTADNSSEKVQVKFDAPVHSIATELAWIHSVDNNGDGDGEHAQVDFYRDGQLIGSIDHYDPNQTDTVDGPYVFAPTNGEAFDTVVFSASNPGDDYLIHSIEADPSFQSYKVDMSSAVTDTDGSEHLSSVTISHIPAGALLFDAEGNAVSVSNGTATVPVDADTQSLQESWTLKVPETAGDFTLSLTAVSSEGATGEDVCELHQDASNQDSDQVTVSSSDEATLSLQDVTVSEGSGQARIGATLDATPTSDLTVTLSNGATIVFDTNYQPGQVVQSTPFDINNGEDPYLDESQFTVSVQSTSGGGFDHLVTTDMATITVNDTIDTTEVSLSVAETTSGGSADEGALDIDSPNINGATDHGDGTSGWDEFNATNHDDKDILGNGFEEVDLRDGNDQLLVGDGIEQLDAGKGDDVVKLGEASNGYASVDMGEGNDQLQVGNHFDEINMGKGNDKLLAGDDISTVDLGKGDDSASLGDANSNSYATVDAGSGDDIVVAGQDFDEVDMGKGDDQLKVEDGVNSVDLGSGDDIANIGQAAGNGYTSIDAGKGDDQVLAGNDFLEVELGEGNDKLDIGNVDTLNQWAQIDAGKGDDTVSVGHGYDEIDMGNGTDKVVFKGDASEWTVTQISSDKYDVTHNATGETTIVKHVESIEFEGSGSTVDIPTVGFNDSGSGSQTPQYVFTATLSNPGQTDVTVHTNVGDILIPSGQTSGTLTLDTSSVNTQEVHVTSVEGGNFEDVSFSNASVNIDLNQAPETTDDSISTPEDTTYTLSLSDFGNYSDVDGDVLSRVKFGSLPNNGTLMINGQPLSTGAEVSAADIQSGHLTFVPNSNTDMDSSFNFKVSDGVNWSGTHTTAVNVVAVADAPDISINIGQPIATETSIAYPLDLSAALNDTDGSESLSVVVSGLPQGASLSTDDQTVSLTDNQDGSWTVTPSQGQTAISDLNLTLTVPADAPDFNIEAKAIAVESENQDQAENVDYAAVDTGGEVSQGGSGSNSSNHHSGHQQGSGSCFILHTGEDGEADYFNIPPQPTSGSGQEEQLIVGFDADKDILDISEVIDTGEAVDQDSLSQYLNFEAVDADGDGQEDDTKITIDSNGEGDSDNSGGTLTEVFIQDETLTETDLDDLKVDYQDQ